MKIFITSASILTLFVGLSSCEKHDWNKTKQLYETHEADGHADSHGESHAEEGKH